MRNICKIYLLETEYVNNMKFQGMEFRDFYELVAKVTEYEELLREESHWRKTYMRTYYQEMNPKVVVVDLQSTRSFTCSLLVKKKPDLWKKSQASIIQV